MRRELIPSASRVKELFAVILLKRCDVAMHRLPRHAEGLC
jgi:hypothetical protein